MGGVTRQLTGTTRKDAAKKMPTPTFVEPPTIEEAAPAAQEELKKVKRQRGRAATIFSGGSNTRRRGASGALGDDSAQAPTGANVKTMLGA